MKIKVKKVYGYLRAESASHLYGSFVAVSDKDNFNENNLTIQKLAPKQNDLDYFTTCAYVAGNLSWKYIAELEIESDEPKVYHAANCEEARHLIDKKMQYFCVESMSWIKCVLNDTDSPIRNSPFDIRESIGNRKYVSLIRELKPATKTYSIEEAQKLLSEKLGEDVRIEG